MLAQLFDSLLVRAADSVKARARTVKTPGIVPGHYQLVTVSGDGTPTVIDCKYPVTLPKYQAHSINAFRQLIYDAKAGTFSKPKPIETPPAKPSKSTDLAQFVTMTQSVESQWHVFVGQNEINGFLVWDEGVDYHAMERVTLKLEETEEWQFATKPSSTTPIELVRKIKRLFTGKFPIVDSQIPSAIDIQAAGNMFSKIAVTQTKRSVTSVSAGNETLGNDINNELALGDGAMPEILSIPVNRYKQHDLLCEVIALCYYDYDNQKIVINPVAHYVTKACDDTSTAIIQALGTSLDPAINPSIPPAIVAATDITLFAGEADLRC